jgi:hypothetical protein
MAVTYEQFARRAQRQAADPERRATLQEERRAQAFVSLRMGDLLGSDDWGLFEQHLAVIRATHAAALAEVEGRILGDALGETLLKLKLEHTRLAGLIAGLDLALGFPATLRAQAAVVEARLAKELDAPEHS